MSNGGKIKVTRKSDGTVKYVAPRIAERLSRNPDYEVEARDTGFDTGEFLTYDVPSGIASGIGAAAGGTLGAPLGPPGMAAGALLGGSIANMLYDVTQGRGPEGPADIPRYTGEKLMQEAAGELAGPAVSVPFRALRKFGRGIGEWLIPKFTGTHPQMAKIQIDQPAEVAEETIGMSRGFIPGEDFAETAGDIAQKPQMLADEIHLAYRKFKDEAGKEYSRAINDLGFDFEKKINNHDVNGPALLGKMRVAMSKFFEFDPKTQMPKLRSQRGGKISPDEAKEMASLYKDTLKSVKDGTLKYSDLERAKGRIDRGVSFDDSAFAKNSPASVAMKDIRGIVSDRLNTDIKGLKEINADYGRRLDVIADGKDYFSSPRRARASIGSLAKRSDEWVAANQAMEGIDELVPGFSDDVNRKLSALAFMKGHDLTQRTLGSEFLHGLGMMGAPLAQHYVDPRLGRSIAALTALTHPPLMAKGLRAGGRLGQLAGGAVQPFTLMPGVNTLAAGLGGSLQAGEVGEEFPNLTLLQ